MNTFAPERMAFMQKYVWPYPIRQSAFITSTSDKGKKRKAWGESVLHKRDTSGYQPATSHLTFPTSLSSLCLFQYLLQDSFYDVLAPHSQSDYNGLSPLPSEIQSSHSNS